MNVHESLRGVLWTFCTSINHSTISWNSSWLTHETFFHETFNERSRAFMNAYNERPCDISLKRFTTSKTPI